jgi:hypothetical protein
MLTKIQQFIRAKSIDRDLSDGVEVRYLLILIKRGFPVDYSSIVGEIMSHDDVDMFDIIDGEINYNGVLRKFILDGAKKWIAQTLLDIEEIENDVLKSIDTEEDCCDIYKRAEELR